MALEYTAHTKFEALAPILEEYAAWFSQIAFCVSYIEDLEESARSIPMPNSFKDWLENPETKETIDPLLLKDIQKIHDDMVRAGDLLVLQIIDATKPAKLDFETFKNLYNAFLIRLRRMEKDTAYEGSGIDQETGLRAQTVLQEDLEEEMERLGRQGNPFCLVVTQINNFPDISDQDKALSVVVGVIKKSMRSFDDAYYLGQGEFLITLKHADKVGGKAAIKRLQAELDERKSKIVMSYCLSEPSVGENMGEMINNMRQDLIDHATEDNIILEVSEMSALERYVAKL